MDKIAILIPCYNEHKTIKKVVEDYRKQMPEASIYVYDNNSNDGTDRLARQAGATVCYEYQQGKGNVIRRMFREIDAQCYLMIDGDDTYPAESARQMCDLVLHKQVDMVIGDRLSSTYFTENKRPFHNIGNTTVRRVINRIFKSDLKDVMTGYRAFSYGFVKTFPVLSNGFEIETEMSIHAVDKRLAIAHVIVDYRDRPEGSFSKLNTISDGIKVLKLIVRLYKNYRPFEFFNAIFISLALLSTAFFIPILITYIRTGLVPNFPTLIVCGFVMIAAIQALFTGLLLSTITQKNRQDFELALLRAHQEEMRLIGPITSQPSEGKTL